MTEALLSVTITTVAGGALLTSVAAGVQTSRDLVEGLIARGLAEQLLNEIAATRFPTATSARPGAIGNRLQFDDLDDYDGWKSRPPTTRSGEAIGTEVARDTRLQPDPRFLARFTQEVQVERIEPNGNGGWAVRSQPTSFRRVTVRIHTSDAQNRGRVMAELTRIFSHVPVTP